MGMQSLSVSAALYRARGYPGESDRGPAPPPSSCPPTKSAPWGAQRLGGESPYPLHAIAIF